MSSWVKKYKFQEVEFYFFKQFFKMSWKSKLLSFIFQYLVTSQDTKVLEVHFNGNKSLFYVSSTASIAVYEFFLF